MAQVAIRSSAAARPPPAKESRRHLRRRHGTRISTDTTAALRANEIGAEVMLKATKVDGIYDSDPKKNPKAKRFTRITYLDALQRRLKVMDSTAFSLCMDNRMPIIVFDLFKPHNIKRVVLGENVGTTVTE